MTFDLATPHWPDDGDRARRHRRVRTRTDPQGRIRSWYRRSQGARQAPGPPAWTTAEIRSARAAGARPCRTGTQLSLDSGAKVGLSKNTVAEIVKRRRATAAQTIMTATLHLVTRMLGPGLQRTARGHPTGAPCYRRGQPPGCLRPPWACRKVFPRTIRKGIAFRGTCSDPTFDRSLAV